jgi:hypothetical protein
VAVINGRITLLVDLYGLVYTVMPHWKKETKSELKPLEVKSAAGGASGKPVVLIAEDSRFFLTQIKSFMEDAGYDVLTAEDGLEAWKTWTPTRRRPHRPDGHRVAGTWTASSSPTRQARRAVSTPCPFWR